MLEAVRIGHPTYDGSETGEDEAPDHILEHAEAVLSKGEHDNWYDEEEPAKRLDYLEFPDVGRKQSY